MYSVEVENEMSKRQDNASLNSKYLSEKNEGK